MSYLYAGTILKIDLGSGKISKEPTSSYSGSFLGGRGINIKLLLDNASPGVDPLGPHNVLVLGVGPLGGSCISAGRTEVTAKSPETGFLGSSNFGGFFAGELKYAGYDHIVLTGKADRPVYLWIENDHVEIKDAASIWGKDTYTAPNIIRQEINNPDAKIITIGPAGENLVRYATIQHEHGHAAGRTGMGAVMGSKNLKAIAVRGTNGIELADPTGFLALATDFEQKLRSHPFVKQLAREGTARDEDDYYKALTVGKFPLQSSVFKKFRSKRAGCFGCPIQCMDHYQEVEGIGSGVISCELYDAWVNDVKCYDEFTSLECGILSQRYGIDAISTSTILEWLMVLYEKGIITEADTGGIPMEWGKPATIRSMLDKIVFRKGIGDVLAEGILFAAKEIGRGSEEYADQVKGLTMSALPNPDIDPICQSPLFSLAFAVGPRGDSLRSVNPFVDKYEGYKELLKKEAKKITNLDKALDMMSYESKAELVAYGEDCICVSDMLSICKWLNRWFVDAITTEHLAELFSAGSGIETDIYDLFDFADKIRTLERAYVAGEGLTRDDDTLPYRPRDLGNKNGNIEDYVLDPAKFEEMKSQYYSLRGWDPQTGVPTQEILKALGLDDVADALNARTNL